MTSTITALFLLAGLFSFAQPNDILVSGKIYEQGVRLKGARVHIYMDGIEMKNRIAKDGEFAFHLDYGRNYEVEFTKKGYITKTITVEGAKVAKSMVKENQKYKTWVVRMERKQRGVDYGFGPNLVGRIFFDFNRKEFDWTLLDGNIGDLTEDVVLESPKKKRVVQSAVVYSNADVNVASTNKIKQAYMDDNPGDRFKEERLDNESDEIRVQESSGERSDIEVRLVKVGDRTIEYKKIKHKWGGVHYTKDGKASNAHIWHTEAKGL